MKQPKDGKPSKEGKPREGKPKEGKQPEESESAPQLEAANRPGRPGHGQAEVLRCAIDLFNSRGYDATSIKDLARALGVTKSAIYHHVSSKEDLLAAALDEALDALTVAVDSAVASASDDTAYDRLRRLVEESVQILCDHLPAVTLLLRVRGNSEVEQLALARRRVIDKRLTALVQDAVDEGAIRADIPPDVISRMVFGAVDSLAEWYRPNGRLEPATLARAVAGMAFDGLTTRPLSPSKGP